MPATTPEAKARRRVAQRRRTAIRYAESREWLDAYKMERGCVECGYRSHPAALEFDHRDPRTKRFGIATSWSRKREDILEEIAKCDLVCANCHRIRTSAQRGFLNVGKPRLPDMDVSLFPPA